MEEVKLLSFWATPFGKRVELALKAKGIPFQYVEENLRNKSELLLTSNPVYKKVPVLIHKGKPICESRYIIQYIDEAWPASPRLLPEDPYDRYLVLFWSDFMDKKSAEVWSQLFTAKLKSAEEKVSVMKKIQEEYAQTRITIEDGLAVLEERGLLYDGKTLKYMDVFFAPSMAWFSPTQKLLGLKMPESDKCPCLHRWMQNLQTNEVVKSTLPDADKLMKHGQASWF